MQSQTPKIEIVEWNEESEEQTWADGWQYCECIGEGMENVFRLAGIRIPSNMQLGHAALRAGKIIGATTCRVYEDCETRYGKKAAALLKIADPRIYDFDIAVHPDFQNGTVGYLLTDANVRAAQVLECDAIHLQVINPKMTRLLVKLFGFYVEREEHRPYYKAYVNRWV